MQVEYSAEHRGDHFFITLRDEAHPNSQLLVALVSDPSDTKASHSDIARHAAFLAAVQLSYSCHCCTIRLLGHTLPNSRQRRASDS